MFEIITNAGTSGTFKKRM